MEGKKINFHIYRYHLLPINKETKQLDAFPPKKLTYEELKDKKNSFFDEILNTLVDNKLNSHPLKLEHSESEYFLFKIAQKKNTTITQNFTNKNIPNEPYCYVIFNNNPAIQKIAISENIDAFSKPETVKNILKKVFNRDLEKYGLNIEIEQMFDSINFWEIVNRYSNQIMLVNFKFIKPNLANISNSLPEDFKKFAEKVNSHESHIIIKAPQNGALDNISKENPEVNGLVDYSSKGAGSIKLKIKGLQKQLNTKEKPLIKTYKELEIEGPSEQVIKLYKLIVE
ncbi:hypothetical protein G9H61_04700 [Aquirufa ecclesiirivi]|uniref:Uncharacterized protein n=1 Tax=Aquirufa ecclesiirivi TaxID=2715124 RepID=A0ABT4JGS4_9BACT|nr:hypothetical protein [Aquirufa ecclesiirivi]MCZ2474731.1 hypothetical protein [Aquirufa ecclesiirivi]